MENKSVGSGVTFFAIPKAFQGHNKIIQLNAIRSWLLLRPQCEIILFGNDEGTAETAAQFGITHIADIERNENGTPLVSYLFSTAQKIARNETLCYVNSDIILLSDFLPAIREIGKSRFLMVGQRWDTDITELLDFNQPDWETQLRERVKNKAKLHAKTGIDYFVFPRGLYDDMPPFAIGRGMWDNWLLYKARASRAVLVDSSQVVMAIHQNHDYSHAGGADSVWKGPEIKRNVEMAGGDDHAFTLEYATKLLTEKGLKAALTPRHVYHRLRAIPMMNPRLRFLLKPLDMRNKMMAAKRQDE